MKNLAFVKSNFLDLANFLTVDRFLILLSFTSQPHILSPLFILSLFLSGLIWFRRVKAKKVIFSIKISRIAILLKFLINY